MNRKDAIFFIETDGKKWPCVKVEIDQILKWYDHGDIPEYSDLHKHGMEIIIHTVNKEFEKLLGKKVSYDEIWPINDEKPIKLLKQFKDDNFFIMRDSWK